LLRGLLDGDGHIAPDGAVELCLSDETLASDAFDLILSLGYKAVMTPSRAGYAGKDCGSRWRITWSPRDNPFGMPRKRERVPEGRRQASRVRHRYIVACELVDTVPVRCITVDSQSALYLAGRQLICDSLNLI
jgi:replicative DNA helicase